MPNHGIQTRGAEHELVILAHLVQMVKTARNVRDEDIAAKLEVSLGEARHLLSEGASLTIEQLRQLFLAVGMTTEGVFETGPGNPEKTVLSPMGFSNAIEQGLKIFNEEASQNEQAGAAGV